MEMDTSRKKHKAFWPKKMVRRWLNGRGGADQLSTTSREVSCTAPEELSVEQEQRCKSFSEKEDPIFMSGSLSGDVDECWSDADIGDELKLKQSIPGSPLPATNPDAQKLRMFVGTWNVAGKAPHDGLNLRDWLRTPASADIYVLGFQEVVPLNAGNVLVTEDRGPAAKWLSLIRQALNNPKKPPSIPEPPVHPDRFRQPRVSFCELITIEDMMEAEDNEWWVMDDSDSGGGDDTTNPNSSDEDASSLASENHPRRRGKWKREGFCLAASKQMVGIFLCVWVRNSLVRDVARVKASCVTRGIMGYMGNKGSISISMTLRQSTFCFICTHLASGEKDRDEERRNYDVVEILKRTRFPRSRRRPIDPLLAPKTILQHGKIIWLGDLNYRLAMSCADTEELLLKNDWNALLEKDQLRIEQKAGKIFTGWKEGKIFFPPTYKYLTNSDRYVVQTEQTREKRRIPAWCDRILWRGEGIKQICYVRGESRFSDHRPVYSIFSVEVAAENGSGTTTPTSTTTTTSNTTTATTTTADSATKKKGYKIKWPVWISLNTAAASTSSAASSSNLRCSSSRSETSCRRLEAEEKLPIGRTQSCRLSSRY